MPMCRRERQRVNCIKQSCEFQGLYKPLLISQFGRQHKTSITCVASLCTLYICNDLLLTRNFSSLGVSGGRSILAKVSHTCPMRRMELPRAMMMTTMKASGTGTSPRTSHRLKSCTISNCQPSLNQFTIILVWRKGIVMKCYKTYIYTYLFHITFDFESVHCQSQVNFHVDFFEGFEQHVC